jgi:MFS family permease
MRIKPPKYILACIAVSLGGLCNGYDSGAIGSITTMAQFAASLGRVSPTMHGWIVSLVMLAGAVPAFFAGYLADRFGRLRVILLGATLYILGAALQAASASVAMFLGGRVVGGLGQGIFLSNVNVYLCEVAPVRHRGRLAGMPQFMTTAGICFGYFTCYGTVDISGSMAWRLPCIVQSCVGGVLGLCCLVLPESPRWLMMRGQSENAVKALQRLNFDMVEAERDILPTSAEQQPSLSLWQSIVILFRRAYRSRTIMALFILGMIQLSGIDAVIYVSVLFLTSQYKYADFK